MIANPQLSEHCHQREIFGAVEPTPAQWRLARYWARNLFEPVRAVIGAPLLITDGLRSFERQQEFIAEGLRPDSRTDHSWMSSWNPCGVGAGDLVPIGPDGRPRKVTRREYDRIQEELFGHGAKFRDLVGQLIWYPVRGHIHLSNPLSLVFTPWAIENLGLPQRRKTYIYPEGTYASAG